MSSTPILDLEEAVPAAPRKWIALAIAFPIGVLIGLMPFFAPRGWPVSNGLLLIPALYVTVAVHELGHLVVGKLAGLEPGGIGVGGFLLKKSGGKWAFRFDLRRWASGGFIMPANQAAFSPLRLTWLVVGGPFASIVLTVVCGIATFGKGSGDPTWGGTLFWVSVWITLGSLVPYSVGINKSDGARLWLLLRHPARVRSWIALLALQAEDATGTLPRDWDASVFDRVLSTEPRASEYSYCQLLAYYRRLDEGDDEAALVHLENALRTSSRVGKMLRHCAFLEAASASLFLRNNREQSRSWHTRATRLRKPEFAEVVDAEIAMCEGRPGDALAHWQAAHVHLTRRKLDSGLARFAKREWARHAESCRTSLEQSAFTP